MSELTFNVIYTRGSVARLLPFSLSLLQSPSIRIRLVANGCDPAEEELLRAVAERDDRLTHHVLSPVRTVEHGAALNELFEAFTEPRFAFVDSDVVATGDFIGGLEEVVAGQAGAFTARVVWMTDEETEQLPGRLVLSGGRPRLDGTFIGNTFCAVYERDLLEPVWRHTPRGFAVHHSYMLPAGLRSALTERGWLFRTYDACRLVNLQLLLAGHTLEERRVPELHHVGGLSVRDYTGLAGKLRQLNAVRTSRGGRMRRVADGGRTYLHYKLRRDPAHETRQRRKSQVLGYVDGVIDSLLANEPAPPAPTTDSAQVDGRVAELIAAVHAEYPKGLAAVREATRAPLSKAVAP